MKTKLTLSIDRDLVDFARRQAQSRKKSISSMFSDYLKHSRTELDKRNRANVVDMTGALNRYKIDDSKRAIRSIYGKKHF